MKSHLYNSKFGKVLWFVKRFGIKELFLKPIRETFSYVFLPFLPYKNRFHFKGNDLPYAYFPQHTTWTSERCLELAIADFYTGGVSHTKTLEVGNVMNHYCLNSHTVLDKYEKYPGVINQDVLDLTPERKYELIFSISSFEHIGFDDEADGTSSAQKILRAIAVCRRCLEPGGKLVLTLPIGYNPELDWLISQNSLGEKASYFFYRCEKYKWVGCWREEAMIHSYNSKYPYANAIMVAEFAST